MVSKFRRNFFQEKRFSNLGENIAGNIKKTSFCMVVIDNMKITKVYSKSFYFLKSKKNCWVLGKAPLFFPNFSQARQKIKSSKFWLLYHHVSQLGNFTLLTSFSKQAKKFLKGRIFLQKMFYQRTFQKWKDCIRTGTLSFEVH